MLKRKRIFVVDDERLLAQTLTLILEQSGYEARMFHDAETALIAARATPPDLVVTDVLLPGMSGIDFAQQLMHEKPPVRSILVSGHASVFKLAGQAHQQCPPLQIHRRPVHPETLLRDIAELLRKPNNS